ncbi:MAG: hypothetical protein VKI81_00810, partial [Synechococcaceae cyanobacterium]|nr:hypothetical protein [Synechococcaceae cyanobacterium]
KSAGVGNADPTPASSLRFYTIDNGGGLTEVASIDAGFLTDGIVFSGDGSRLYAANEGEPNDDYSIDPIGSVSIVSLDGDPENPSMTEQEIAFPDLDSGVTLLGSGIRYSGKDGVTVSFGQDAEAEYLAEAGGYLFVTLQENNTVARIDLTTNLVDAYIGLGWVDYSQVSVDLDDRDAGFAPLTGQKVVGLRQPDGIAAWEEDGNPYFITANEGDSREYEDGGYIDERRNSGLGFESVPERLKLIVDGNNADRALVLSNRINDQDPANDLAFLEPSKPGKLKKTPVSFGSRSLTIFDGITGLTIWDSWMTDTIDGEEYNTSLQNIAEFAGVYDDGRSDDKGVEVESVAVLEYEGSRYALAVLERTDAGDGAEEIPRGGLLVVYDITDLENVDFVTYQTVSRSPEGIEILPASESPTGQLLVGISSEFDSNSVELLDFGTLITNGQGTLYLSQDNPLNDPSLYATL